MTTTILIVAKNEAEGIRRIIRSIKPYADEIIVIDGYSTDDTYKEARKEVLEVFGNKWSALYKSEDFREQNQKHFPDGNIGRTLEAL